MTLIALYDFYYGKPGKMDAEPPIVRFGEEFEPLPTSQASAQDIARHLVANGAAVTPEGWAKRKTALCAGHEWAAAEVAQMNANRKSVS